MSSRPALAMKTKTTTLSSLWLLMMLILGLLCQQIQAGVVVNQKSGKPKNSTIVNKETPTANGKNKYVPKSSSSTTTTTTSTTAKPKLELITTKLPEIDVDSRHAYINNQYVADQEAMPDNTPALYEMIQKQMENVFSNTGASAQVFNDNPEAKKVINGNVNNPGKPMFVYNMNQFNDYDEENENGEELTEQEEQNNENCEDTEENLSENDDNSGYGNVAQNPQSVYNQPQQQQNPTPYELPQTQKPTKDPYDSSNYNSQSYNNPETGYGHPSKPSSSYHHSKQPAQPQNPYGQTTQNQQLHKPAAAQEKPKLSYSNKLAQAATSPSGSSSKPHHKPHASHKPPKQLSYADLTNTNYASQSSQQPLNKPNEALNKPANHGQNINNGNSQFNSVSPFSTPSSSGNSSGGDKHPKRRHVTFRTVSSSTQFVSTPLADLMLKFSIGMAKPSKPAAGYNHHSQIYDKNDIELTT